MAALVNPAIALTVGHSTLPPDAFLELLRKHGVERVVDVRTIPRSCYNLQFNGHTLKAALRMANIVYTHVKALGGLRHARADSQNMGWRNAGFRGYADYMQTSKFEQGLAHLLELLGHERCAILCAEAVPWRCHRSLIADALLVRGIRVEHIMSSAKRDVHQLTSFACVRGTSVTYPRVGVNETPAPQDVIRRTEGQLALQYAQTMPSKKRKTKYTAAKEAKRQAREAAGSPPPERIIADKRRKLPKHKKPLADPNV